VAVPRDLVSRDDGRPEVDAFGFHCEGCNAALRVSRRAVDGHAVCPVCHTPLTIPRLGYALTPSRAPWSGDPREILHASTPSPCPQCEKEIPKHAQACPYCGFEPAP
jgi:hypothetical protein